MSADDCKDCSPSFGPCTSCAYAAESASQNGDHKSPSEKSQGRTGSKGVVMSEPVDLMAALEKSIAEAKEVRHQRAKPFKTAPEAKGAPGYAVVDPSGNWEWFGLYSEAARYIEAMGWRNTDDILDPECIVCDEPLGEDLDETEPEHGQTCGHCHWKEIQKKA